MDEEAFGDTGGIGVDVSSDSSGDASSYIQTQLDTSTGPTAAVSVQPPAQTTSWIQDALGYVKTGVSYASGVAANLGIKVAGVTTPTVTPVQAVQGGTTSPQPVQVGQGGTGAGMPWYFYGLIAAAVLLVLYFLLYE